MTLSCENPWRRRSYGAGVFINEVTIVDVEDISGTIPTFMQNPVDIGLKMTLEVGRAFQPTFTIAGNFKKDDITEEVVGWGSAFAVQEALFRLGHAGSLNAENKIPPQVLTLLIGKRFLRLSYVSGLKNDGRARYSDWNIIATVEEGPEALAAKFRRCVARGYPRNYHPDVISLEGNHQEVIAEPSDDAF